MKDLVIIVDSNDDLLECPLRTDFNSCSAVSNSKINSCPLSMDIGDVYTYVLPDFCPLRKGNVVIKLKV